jgi:Zn-dependent protease
MIRAWKIGTAFGIDVRIHWLFFLVPVYLVYSSLKLGESWPFIGLKLVWMVAVFACVLFHEFGHSFAARYFGIPTLDITLLPIGGVARLQRNATRSHEELAIALAGPAVNLAIAVLLFVPWAVFSEMRIPREISLIGADFLFFVMLSNVALLVFNLVPAYPMDGGRVVRAFLSWVMPSNQATIWAARLGQSLAILAGIFSVLFSFWSLFLIAFIIFFAASYDIYIAKRMEIQVEVARLKQQRMELLAYHASVHESGVWNLNELQPAVAPPSSGGDS